jgi:formate C-acetyltransferase
MYIILGKRTNATSDGRYAGDETSKNASPTAGMDTNGVTALILSVLKTKPYQFTEGHCLDIMLHPSAVQGEEGLKAFKGLLDVYENGGGMSLNVNILNSEILKKAQLEPEKYQNLQVRVCGWNVLFNNMPKEEQDEYIKRAENLK